MQIQTRNENHAYFLSRIEARHRNTRGKSRDKIAANLCSIWISTLIIMWSVIRNSFTPYEVWGFTAPQLCDRHEHVQLRKEGRTDWEPVPPTRRPCGLAWTGTSLLGAQPGRTRLSCHGRLNAKQTTRTKQTWSPMVSTVLCPEEPEGWPEWLPNYFTLQISTSNCLQKGINKNVKITNSYYTIYSRKTHKTKPSATRLRTWTNTHRLHVKGLPRLLEGVTS